MSVEPWSRLLEVVEDDILPLTRDGVAAGNKIFGAAILRSADLSVIVAGTNEETACPLWHGEMVTIRNLYLLPEAERPPPSECLFLSTHEPCAMCLSAITWGGYPAIYYLFGYEQTRDRFHIPHDLRILKEVFAEDGKYSRENQYWKIHDIVASVAECDPEDRVPLVASISRLREQYDELSNRYQSKKGEGSIPLP